MSKLTLEELRNKLSPNSGTQSYKLKTYLFEFQIKKRVCEICKLSQWRDEEIPLELHHVDGDNSNNSILNIQILCPNCHALTENYRGKGKSGQKIINQIDDNKMINAVSTSYNYRQALQKCGLSSYGGSYARIKRLVKKNNLSFLEKPSKNKQPKENIEKPIKVKTRKPQVYKIDWPEKEKLEEMIKNQSILSISRQLLVSDNAVRKRAKKYGIDIKSINKWSKTHGSKPITPVRI